MRPDALAWLVCVMHRQTDGRTDKHVWHARPYKQQALVLYEPVIFVLDQYKIRFVLCQPHALGLYWASYTR